MKKCFLRLCRWGTRLVSLYNSCILCQSNGTNVPPPFYIVLHAFSSGWQDINGLSWLDQPYFASTRSTYSGLPALYLSSSCWLRSSMAPAPGAIQFDTQLIIAVLNSRKTDPNPENDHAQYYDPGHGSRPDAPAAASFCHPSVPPWRFLLLARRVFLQCHVIFATGVSARRKASAPAEHCGGSTPVPAR